MFSFRRTLPPPDLGGAIKRRYPLAAATTSAASIADWPGGLIPLPRDYAELMNLVGEFVCENSVTGRYRHLGRDSSS